jgi:hypothetical protein
MAYLLAVTLWALGAVLVFDINDEDHKKNGESSELGEAIMCFMWPFYALWRVLLIITGKN